MSVNSLFEQGLYLRPRRLHAPSPSPHPHPTPTSVLRFATRITLDKVSLRYPDTDTNAVDDASLKIQHGQTIALVGENGSGKTSLAALIAF
ncbi:ATP-binding cassette domain-containing protein [Phytomonospora sp. NPDC050363]|uniref:ATP-binding cassette domain-containing protein n=1 Tax=Phytomonospora sp. NPDC050363 TaxID=3155642 RepID=UPI00340783B1